ncbi:MAG: hypothetical protein ACOY30_03780 [Bacillota bacterium]
MVKMSINNFHPDSVQFSVIASTLDKTLASFLEGVGVVVPHKISELEYVVRAEVEKCFADFSMDSSNIKTDLIFDQDTVLVKVSRQKGSVFEEIFTTIFDRWNE